MNNVDPTMVKEVCRELLKRYNREYMLTCSKENRFPSEFHDSMAETGLLGLGVPDEYGGMGGGVKELVTVIETFTTKGVDPPTLMLTGFPRNLILKHGTEDQIKKYVVPTTEGDLRLSFALTEPDAGSNSFKISSLASRTDKGTYILNGQKVFISEFKETQYALVVARTQLHDDVESRTEGMSIFIVDTKSPGIEANPLDIATFVPMHKQYQVFFNDVELPADNLIGKEGQAFRYMFDALNPERLMAAAQSIGRGEWILSKGVEYAKIRAPFDSPIGSYQAIQHPMAYAKAHLEGARSTLYRAVEIYDKGGKAGPLAAIAKLLASDAFFEAVNITITAHGGYAFDNEYDIMDAFIEARIGQTVPVSTNLILNYIGEHILKLPKSY